MQVLVTDVGLVGCITQQLQQGLVVWEGVGLCMAMLHGDYLTLKRAYRCYMGNINWGSLLEVPCVLKVGLQITRTNPQQSSAHST